MFDYNKRPQSLSVRATYHDVRHILPIGPAMYTTPPTYDALLLNCWKATTLVKAAKLQRGWHM
jgi:hypothetical protein